MIGAAFKITHQNPEYLKDAEKAFNIKDSDGPGYKEVFFYKEPNTDRLYIGVGGNTHASIAQLDDIARKTLMAFLEKSFS